MTGLAGLIGRWHRPQPRPASVMINDPFAELGLDRAADLTDDEVRAAWRRIAAATHPDRADGGDPGRFALAAAAYTELRTRYGRGEARAALATASERDRAGAAPADELGGADGDDRDRSLSGGSQARGSQAGGSSWGRLAVLTEVGARVRAGRPARLVVRVLAVAVASAGAAIAAGPGPAVPALVTGAVTWLALSIRKDLGPLPRSRRHPRR